MAICHFEKTICHYVILPLCHFAILSLCHFTILTLAILKNDLPFCHYVILLLCHFAIMSFCQKKICHFATTYKNLVIFFQKSKHQDNVDNGSTSSPSTNS